MRETHSALRPKRAQALAEMAVMVPFLVIGMMGMLDLGRAFYYQISLTNAVREAARYAALPSYQGITPACNTIPPAATPGPNCPSPSDAQVTARLSQELNGTGIGNPTVTVSPDQTGRTSNYNNATPVTQYPITVTASYKFAFITPIIGQLVGDANGQLTINTSAVFRSEY